MRIVIGGSTKAEKLSPANMSHSSNALKLQTITQCCQYETDYKV